MACRLFGHEPLPETIPTYWKLIYQKQTSTVFESKYIKIFQGNVLEDAVVKGHTFVQTLC